MRIRRARLDELEFSLVEPFETSFGVERRRRFLLLTLESETGEEGFAECVASRDPAYSSETTETARWMLSRYLLPFVLTARTIDARRFALAADRWRGHRMAKAVVEMALADLEAKRRSLPLYRWLGGRRTRVEVGVSVGIQPDPRTLVRRVGEYLSAGYRRVKLKVRPGWDATPLARVRKEYPDLRLWVDANQAYPPTARSRIVRWATTHNVEQVEQPFPERALHAHAALVATAKFRVCLDESIVDTTSLTEAIELRALTSLNVKPGRVAGLHAARTLQAQAARAHISAWVGGMLETGVGRAHGIHLATLPNFRLPGDLSASDRYYADELIDRPFVLGSDSTLEVPRGPGIGVDVDARSRRRHLVRSRSFGQ